MRNIGSQVARLNLQLVTGALNALQNLVSATDQEIYSTAPECQVRVNRAQDAIQDAYEILTQVQEELRWISEKLSTASAETLARRILEEAEEAFEAKSVAEKRARCGKLPAQSPSRTISSGSKTKLRLKRCRTGCTEIQPAHLRQRTSRAGLGTARAGFPSQSRSLAEPA